nr:hypothetical protein DM860_017167 [Ipomoea batatas]
MGSASAPDGGDNSIYTIDAAKKMKYDELFPVEAKKFGYDPKAKANSVEQALDDRVKKKADRYCKYNVTFLVTLTFIHWEISKLHIGTVMPVEVIRVPTSILSISDNNLMASNNQTVANRCLPEKVTNWSPSPMEGNQLASHLPFEKVTSWSPSHLREGDQWLPFSRDGEWRKATNLLATFHLRRRCPIPYSSVPAFRLPCSLTTPFSSPSSSPIFRGGITAGKVMSRAIAPPRDSTQIQSLVSSVNVFDHSKDTSCCLNGKNFAELVDAGFGLRSGHDGLVVVADELVPARA